MAALFVNAVPYLLFALALAVRHQKSLTTWQAAILGVIGTGIAYVLDYQVITSEGATFARRSTSDNKQRRP